MTGSISRKLYRRVLLLYPKPFRHEFGDEMLSMFGDCRAAQGSWHVLADVLLSAAKQQIHYLSIPAPKSAPTRPPSVFLSGFSVDGGRPKFGRRIQETPYGARLTAFVGSVK